MSDLAKRWPAPAKISRFAEKPPPEPAGVFLLYRRGNAVDWGYVVTAESLAVHPPLTSKDRRRLARDLNGPLLFRIVYHGFFILGAPFLAFALFSAPGLKPVATLTALAACLAAAYICIWDYVRLCRKRGTEPFCMLWLPPAAPLPRREDAAEYPDAQNDAPPPRRITGAVHKLTLIYLGGFIFSAAALAVLLATLPGGVPEPLTHASLSVLPWGFVCFWLVYWQNDQKLKQNPELAAAARAALPSGRAHLTHMRHRFFDFAFWSFFVAPLWSLLLLPGWLYLPFHSAPQEMHAFYSAPPPESGAGFHALTGLAAPDHVEDFIAYGRALNEQPHDAQPAPYKLGQLWRTQVPHTNICAGRKPTEEETKAETILGEDGIWIYPPVPCDYLETWEKALPAYQSRLARLEALYGLSGFSTPQGGRHAEYSTDILLGLARLKTLDIIRKVYSGESEAALQDMLAAARFSRRLLAEPRHLTDYAVARTLHNIFLGALPHLAAEAPALVAARQDDLLAVLYYKEHYPAAELAAVWDADIRNVAAMMDGQIGILITESRYTGVNKAMAAVLWPGRNIARQLFYGLRNDTHAALNITADEERSRAFKQLEKKYDTGPGQMFQKPDDVLAMYPTAITRLLMGGVAKGLMLFDLDPSPDRAMRALVLAAAAGIRAEDMPVFLEAGAMTDPLMRDRNGKAFFWRAETRGVCFNRTNPYHPAPDPRCYAAPVPVRNAAHVPDAPAPNR